MVLRPVQVRSGQVRSYNADFSHRCRHRFSRLTPIFVPYTGTRLTVVMSFLTRLIYLVQSGGEITVSFPSSLRKKHEKFHYFTSNKTGFQAIG